MHRAHWLKLVFLFANTLCNRVSFSPPNPPVEAVEEASFQSSRKSQDLFPGIGRWLPFNFKIVVHMFNIVEMYAILSAYYPQYKLPIPHKPFVPTPSYTVLARIRPTTTHIVGSGIIHIATIICALCYHGLGQHFTYELSIQSNHKLITGGPYAVVRHPSYTGILVFMVCVGLAQMSSGSWWVAGGLYWTDFGKVVGVVWASVVLGGMMLTLSRIPKEDGVLRRKFGRGWEIWERKNAV